MTGVKCPVCGGYDGNHERSCTSLADYYRRAAARQKIDAEVADVRGGGTDPPPDLEEQDTAPTTETRTADVAAGLVDEATTNETDLMNFFWQDLRHHDRATRWRVLEWLRAKSEGTP